MKDSEEPNSLKNLPPAVFPAFANPFFTPPHLWPPQLLRQYMTAFIAPADAALFHPSFMPPWDGQPKAPATACADSLSSSHKERKLNNNNLVSSSSTELQKKAHWKAADLPLSSPTSSTSPPSSTDVGTRDVNRDKQFTCGVCHRSFGYKHVLQNHERTHTGEKPFECSECKKRFTRDHHLKTHMRLHTGERPYRCEHCDRQFVQVANLRRHLRVHTGERPYSCQECSSKFSDSNQLKAHALIHTDQKPFQCPKCLSRFRRKHHLHNHKCGTFKEESPVSDGHNTTPSETPLDLSMSTGLYQHSSDESPLSRSPSSREDLDLDDCDPLYSTRSASWIRAHP